MRFIGFIYYFILWPIILYIAFAITPIFGLVILLVVLREYWKLYKLGTIDMVTRMLASDVGWFKQFVEVNKSLNKAKKTADIIAKQAGKK